MNSAAQLAKSSTIDTHDSRLTRPRPAARNILEPPYSLAAEESVLGGLERGSATYEGVASVIGPQDFYRPDHRVIFTAIGQMAAAGKAVDVVSLADQLERDGSLEGIGGTARLATLAADTLLATDVLYHAEIIAEKARERRLLNLGGEVSSALKEGATSAQIVAALLPALQALERRSHRAVTGQWLSDLGAYVAPAQIVWGLLAAGSLVVIYGESNSGKTFLILDICMAVARGVPWRQLRTQAGLVVYVAGEGAASVRARLAAYIQTIPGASTAPFLLMPAGVDLLDASQVGALIQAIRAAESERTERTAILVFDTLARAMAGGDESSTQDMGLVVASADRIRAEIGCAVVFIHHAGKDPAKGARGSSALRAACDSELLVEGQSGARTVTVTKQRDLPYGEPIAFELKSVVIGRDPDTGEDITSCVVSHCDSAPAAAPPALRGKAQRQMVAALRVRTNDDPSHIWTLGDLREIGRELGLSKSTARYAVDALVATPYMQATVGGYKFIDGDVK